MLLDKFNVSADKMMGSSAKCTPLVDGDTATRIAPGNSLACTVNISLTQADLEADAVNITAHADSVTLTSAVVTAVAQQPLQLLPNPTLQLGLDVLADTCVLKASNSSGGHNICYLAATATWPNMNVMCPMSLVWPQRVSNCV